MTDQPGAAGLESARIIDVSVELGLLALEAIGGEGVAPATLRLRVALAIRAYLADRGSSRPGWPYPALVQERASDRTARLELSIDEGTWRSLQDEASRHAVSVEQMAAHAVLYYAAELDRDGDGAGRPDAGRPSTDLLH